MCIFQFKRLGIPLTVIFIRATRKPAHNNGCGPVRKKGRPITYMHVAVPYVTRRQACVQVISPCVRPQYFYGITFKPRTQKFRSAAILVLLSVELFKAPE
jgi:hypothetical protein